MLLARSLDGWSSSTVYVGFADGTLALLTSLPWLVLTSSLGVSVPVFLGIFLSLWLLLPVTPGLPLRQVIVRGCVAAAFALAGTFLVGILALGLGPMGWGAEYPVEIVESRGQFDSSPFGPWHRLREALSMLLDVLPATVLGGILLWAWERRVSTAQP